MPEKPCFVPIFASVLVLIFSVPAVAKSEKNKKSMPRPIRLIEDYRTLDRVRMTLETKTSFRALESAQRELLLLRLKTEVRGLDREFDELFSLMELKKAQARVKRNPLAALEHYERGLQGLPTAKWPWYWRTDYSEGLSEICKTESKKGPERCLAIARRLVDAFPKSALETRVLRELDLPKSGPGEEVSGERLSQPYPEKTDKDELAFKELLEAYLKGNRSEVESLHGEFRDQFPKSALRFRANFLRAELLNRAGRTKEAAPLYQEIIDQIPLSYYSILAHERLGRDAKSLIRDQPIEIDPGSQELTPEERSSLARAQDLVRAKRGDLLSFEFEVFTRTRFYSTDFLISLMRLSFEGGQYLLGFRWANELIQRKSKWMTTSEMMKLLFPEPFWNEIQNEAQTAQVDPILIQSLMKQESGFRPQALSSSGAMGLMQVMPFTALEVDSGLRLAGLRDPQVNIPIGTRYFSSLMTKFEGNPVYALAAYNAGPTRVMKWKKELGPDLSILDWVEAIPFKETRDYVTSILRNRYWYQVQKGVPPVKLSDLKGLTGVPSTDKK